MLVKKKKKNISFKHNGGSYTLGVIFMSNLLISSVSGTGCFPRCPLRAITVVFNRSNRILFLMKVIVSEYRCPVLAAIFSAILLNKCFASFPISISSRCREHNRCEYSFFNFDHPGVIRSFIRYMLCYLIWICNQFIFNYSPIIFNFRCFQIAIFN